MFKRKKITSREEMYRKSSGGYKALLRFVFYFLSILFVGVNIYTFLFSPFTEIGKVQISGIEELDYESVLSEANSYVEGKYLNFIPRNNFFLLVEEGISAHLKEKFKKINSVKLVKFFPNRIIVEISEHKSLIVLCSGGPCHIIDEKGYAYMGTSLDSREVLENNLVQVIDGSAKPVETGKKVMNEEYVIFLSNIKDKLGKGLNLEILSEYRTRSLVAEEVEIKTIGGWNIYLSSKIPLEKSARMMKTFLEKEEVPGLLEKLEYVDLRIEDKVFYRIKNSEQETDNEKH